MTGTVTIRFSNEVLEKISTAKAEIKPSTFCKNIIINFLNGKLCGTDELESTRAEMMSLKQTRAKELEERGMQAYQDAKKEFENKLQEWYNVGCHAGYNKGINEGFGRGFIEGQKEYFEKYKESIERNMEDMKKNSEIRRENEKLKKENNELYVLIKGTRGLST